MAEAMIRRLVVMRVEGDMLPSRPGEGTVLDIDRPLDSHLSDWRLVSHDVVIDPGGAALVSFVLERPAAGEASALSVGELRG